MRCLPSSGNTPSVNSRRRRLTRLHRLRRPFLARWESLHPCGNSNAMAKRVDDATLGNCMQGYYGGRAEVRIRHTPVPVVYTDFTSQYPTANTLLGLWPMLIADRLSLRDATHEVRAFLNRLDLKQLLKRSTWPKLNFFALVQPQGDILPVRTVYGREGAGDQTNIGLNPLISGK